MARTKSTDATDESARTYTRRSPAERAQNELDKANARVEKAQKRVEKAQAEQDAAAKELARAERFKEYAASSPDLPDPGPTQSDEAGTDDAQFSDEPQGESVESAV